MDFPEGTEQADLSKLQRDRSVNPNDKAVVIAKSAPDREAGRQFERQMREFEMVSRTTRNDIEKEELRRLRQQHSQRSRFFYWAVITISAVLVMSAIFMLVYFSIRGSEVEAAVMIAWLSSGLVETLGLGYIIANYLFDDGAGRGLRGRAANAKTSSS